MRFHILLWFAVILLAEASALVRSSPDAADKSVEYPNRALRIDDERVGVPGLSTVAGLLSKTGPSAETLTNKLWLLARTDPMKVFNTLRLGQAGTKLDGNPKVLQWLKYVEMYRPTKYGHRWHDGEIYAKLLQSSKSEAEVAKLFQSLKTNPEFAKLGESLQKAQFGSWRSKKMHPNQIPSMLRLKDGTPLNDPKTEIVKAYALEYAMRTGLREAGDNTKLSYAELATILRAD